jgi:hypothetical protein
VTLKIKILRHKLVAWWFAILLFSYNFAIKEDDLKSNGRLFKLIKDRMKQKLVGNTKVSYKIFSTNFEQNYCYVIAYSRKVQE